MLLIFLNIYIQVSGDIKQSLEEVLYVLYYFICHVYFNVKSVL